MKAIYDAGVKEISRNGVDEKDGFIWPSYVEDIMGPQLFDYGYGPFRWVCLSGKHEDLIKTDHAAMECIDVNRRGQDLDNYNWIRDAEKNQLVVGNMVFFVQGQYDFKRIIRLVEKYLLDIPDVRVENRRTPPPLYVPEHLTVPRDTHQAHVMIGSRGYNAYDDKRTALYLLNNILGGPGMNSKLNVSLRERRGLVYNVESNLTSYTDTGAFCIYFGTDVDDMDTCLKLTYKELKRMRDVKMTSSQLAAAKKQLIGQIGVASDNFENNALGMAKTYLHYHKYESSELVFKRIEELTAEQLLEVANEMFAEEYLSTLIYK